MEIPAAIQKLRDSLVHEDIASESVRYITQCKSTPF